MSNKNLKRLVWAVDVMDDEDHKHALFLLGALTRSSGADVEPIFVLSPPYASFAAGNPPDFEQAFRALAEKRLRELAHKSDLANISSGTVIAEHDGSLRKMVQNLIGHAQSRRADAIVVATHAKKALSRLFLSSFAETMALQSPIPPYIIRNQLFLVLKQRMCRLI